MENQLETPVLFLTFNRPSTTKLVFEEIRKARPKKLFVNVDGPRNDGEKDKVEEVKKIVSNVDWPCKVKFFIRERNIGIAKGWIEAIDWCFKDVEKVIILEDDALPNEDFFRFCEEMLIEYKDNPKIMHITGCNFQRGWENNGASYYFSVYAHTYAWAIWKEKRKKYDREMKGYLQLREQFKKMFPNLLERTYLKRVMDDAYSKNVDAVDTKWGFSILKNDGLCIIPNKNLITNIGFGKDSTHTTDIDSYFSLPREKMEFPLKHPTSIVRDKEADERYVKWLFRKKLKKYLLLKTGLYKFF